MKDTTDRILLRIPEAAEKMGIGRSTLYELLSTGHIPSVRIGRSVRIPRKALELWVDQRVVTQGHMNGGDHESKAA